MGLRRLTTTAIVTATLAGILVALPAPVVAAAPTLPTGFLLQDIPTGLRPPSASRDPGDLITDFAFLPDESMLVAGKYGKVVWTPHGGTPRQIALLDVVGAQDLGLVGLAVAPDYATSRVVYTARSVPDTGPGSGANGIFRLSRWLVAVDEAGAPTGLTDEQAVLTVSADSNVHGMTGVVAAEDGTLWVSVGDSAGYGNVDPTALRSLNLDDPHGKLLHLRADGTGVPSNPYYDPANPNSLRGKVYASGFRSPFRFSLDPVSGRPVLGDVGWNTYEEIDLVEPGNDYGWPCWEANDPSPGYRDLPGCAGRTTVSPLWSYSHASIGRSVSGGVVYTGSAYPAEYQGRYFFGDYHSHRIWTMAFDRRGTLVTAPEEGSFGQSVGAPVKFATMPSGGDIVFADISAATVRRLVYAPGNNPPVAVVRSDNDPATRTVTFDATGSADPNGDTLAYSWDFGDGTTATGAKVSHTYPGSPDSFTAVLTVTDPLGSAGSSAVSVHPSNFTPVLSVQEPRADELFAVGDVISSDAVATDQEDGDLSVRWVTDVVHCAGVGNCHSHPGERQEGPRFRMAFEGHAGDTRLEITAIATDSKGATTTRTFVALPRQRRVTVQSSTPAAITIGPEQTSSGLFTVGQQLTVVAPESAGDRVATFDSWADGAPRVRSLVLPDADVTLDVSYLTPLDRRYAADAALRATVGTPVAVEQGDATVRWRQFTGGYVYWSPETGVHEVHGAILASYLAAGAHLKFGVPISDELVTSDGRGRYSLFSGGRAIYWKPETGSHTLLRDIYPKWTAMGREGGILGYPSTDQTRTPDGVALFNDFERGSIYWHPELGANEVHGAIRTVWYDLAREKSVLGYPSTDERTTPDGVGRYNHFQRGSVYWHPSTGAYEVHGAIRDRWAALGWELSYLGYPTSNEFEVSGGRRSNFQRGYIVWNRATGKVTDYRY